jgi:hypothetical protein
MATLSLARAYWPGIYDVCPVLSWSFSTNDAKDSKNLHVFLCMIPAVLAQQTRRGVEDFLRTTFPISIPFFHGMLDRLLTEDGEVFKGPRGTVAGGVPAPFWTAGMTGRIGPLFSFSPPLYSKRQGGL